VNGFDKGGASFSTQLEQKGSDFRAFGLVHGAAEERGRADMQPQYRFVPLLGEFRPSDLSVFKPLFAELNEAGQLFGFGFICNGIRTLSLFYFQLQN